MNSAQLLESDNFWLNICGIFWSEIQESRFFLVMYSTSMYVDSRWFAKVKWAIELLIQFYLFANHCNEHEHWQNSGIVYLKMCPKWWIL